MAITYPRTMPRIFGLSARFRQERVDRLSPERRGVIGGVTAGWPLWRIFISFNNLSLDEDDELTAWIDSLRGVQKRFYAFDHSRRLPGYHEKSGRPFTDRTSTWSQTIDSEGTAYLTLGGLLAGQVFSYRDWIGFEWGSGRRALVRCLERGVVSAAGMVTVAIEPAVHLVVPPTATVNLREPTCLARLLDDTELPDHGISHLPAGARIAAIQDIVP